jgi:pyruvate,water dikinase
MSVRGAKYILQFKDVGKQDVKIAGGKGANLGEMTRAGLPVPPGFIVTSDAYSSFIERSGLRGKIEQALASIDYNNNRVLEKTSAAIEHLINTSAMPDDIADEIKRSYFDLSVSAGVPIQDMTGDISLDANISYSEGEGIETIGTEEELEDSPETHETAAGEPSSIGGVYVAVRSSATAEDLPKASFAGQQVTFLNVRGADNVVDAVKRAWASLFEARAIFYRHEEGYDHFRVGIAIPVQKMIESEKSGIMFTVEPLTSNRDQIEIEAIYGLGEAVVSGELTPDSYVVRKSDLSVIEKHIAEQAWKLELKEGKNQHIRVPENLRGRQKLSDDEIIALSRYGLKLEEHYGFPQDAEWAIEAGNIYLVQTRPVTTLINVGAQPTAEAAPSGEIKPEAGDTQATRPKPMEETKLIEETKPVSEGKPVAKVEPGVEAARAPETKPVAEIKPGIETGQTAEAKAGELGGPGEAFRPGEGIQPGEIGKAAERGEPTRIAPARELQIGGIARKSGEVVLEGTASSTGIASGAVKIVHSKQELDKVIQGDVLVTPMTNPDYVPAMRRAVAIITDAGGRTSHAAIVSRELGIPSVVGTGSATSLLRDGDIVSVDGARGIVYAGEVFAKPLIERRAEQAVQVSGGLQAPIMPSATGAPGVQGGGAPSAPGVTAPTPATISAMETAKPGGQGAQAGQPTPATGAVPGIPTTRIPGMPAANVLASSSPVTATKLYINLAEPDLAAQMATLPVDGVGLLRAEFMIAGIGTHPRKFIEENRQQEFINKLADGLREFAQAFYPRPVIYRTSDFKTNEYRELEGGGKYEKQENNPMIGYRGVSRYVKERDEFEMELAAIKKVRDSWGLKNLWVMLPFVRKVGEVEEIKQIMQENGLKRSSDFKLWLMVEVPSMVLLTEDFCRTGIDGVSIGSNDLTQLVLGIDRDSEVLADEFDERDPAVMKAMFHVIRVCKRYGVTSSICGQAPSTYPEITEALVRHEITSVSVNSDAVVQTRSLIASTEQRMILEYLERMRESGGMAA